MKLPELTDREVLTLYADWSESHLAASFMPNVELVTLFRADLAVNLAEGLPPLDGDDLELLRLYREQEASVPE